MDPDITMITGLGLALLAIPSMIDAWADRRVPYVASALLVLAGGMVAYAVQVLGLPLTEAPDALYRVVGRILI
ncbi:MAG: hypothetical protein N4A61_14280 [Pelagimonas sp.]|jgi:hypothetical protein|nr:hypothetical protein [Pelagimonas sp.]